MWENFGQQDLLITVKDSDPWELSLSFHICARANQHVIMTTNKCLQSCRHKQCLHRVLKYTDTVLDPPLTWPSATLSSLPGPSFSDETRNEKSFLSKEAGWEQLPTWSTILLSTEGCRWQTPWEWKALVSFFCRGKYLLIQPTWRHVRAGSAPGARQVGKAPKSSSSEPVLFRLASTMLF